MGKILITGASGLIGSRLTSLLTARGNRVSHLGRGAGKLTPDGVAGYSWDIDRGTVDERAWEGVECIIHLAGAAVADKRWTDKRKKEILDSRIKSAGLIYDSLAKGGHSVKTFISASAVGYYGDCGDTVITEEHGKGEGFLADVCEVWEAQAKRFSTLGIRDVSCRIGIVLAKEGGALPQLMMTAGMGVVPYFNKENLYFPWVHIDDVCGMIIHAIENTTVQGAVNVTSNQPLLMKSLLQECIKAKHATTMLMPVPPFLIKAALGEKSEMVLSSQRCTAAKILSTGYTFSYPTIEAALGHIYAKK